MRDEVVRGRSATIALQLYDDETRVESSTDVTVAVHRADGTEVLPAGSATTTPESTIGRYERALTPAQLPEVDILTATWSVTLNGQTQTRATTVEVIGAHYFELAELRAMPGLSDTVKYATSKLAEARTKAQDEIESAVGASFVERYGETTFTGRCANYVLLPAYVRRILSGSYAGVAYTDGELATMQVRPYGQVVRTSGYFGTATTGDVILRYVHGWTTLPPTDVHGIALELARQHALGWRSTVSDDPVEADDIGRETPSSEAVDRTTGQDQIARVLAAWARLYVPAVA